MVSTPVKLLLAITSYHQHRKQSPFSWKCGQISISFQTGTVAILHLIIMVGKLVTLTPDIFAQFSVIKRELMHWLAWGSRTRQLKLKPICLLLEYHHTGWRRLQLMYCLRYLSNIDVLLHVTYQMSHGSALSVTCFLQGVLWHCYLSLGCTVNSGYLIVWAPQLRQIKTPSVN